MKGNLNQNQGDTTRSYVLLSHVVSKGIKLSVTRLVYGFDIYCSIYMLYIRFGVDTRDYLSFI